jgi:hypothetical protein
VGFLAWLFLAEDNRRAQASWWSVGFCSGALAILPSVLQAGEKLSQALVYTFTSFDHGGGIKKLALVFRHFFVQKTSFYQKNSVFRRLIRRDFFPGFRK